MFREYMVHCQECGLESISNKAIDSEAPNMDGLKCTNARHHSIAGLGAPRDNVRVISFEDKALNVSDALPYERTVRSNRAVVRKDSESEAGFAVRAYLSAAYGHIGQPS